MVTTIKDGWELVVGLEVHVELNTVTKMWCGCSTDFGAPPNTNVCPVCTGQPGALPVVNGEAVRSATLLGLALNCGIAETCQFHRKNYFYPDLAKNYQGRWRAPPSSRSRAPHRPRRPSSRAGSASR